MRKRLFVAIVLMALVALPSFATTTTYLATDTSGNYTFNLKLAFDTTLQTYTFSIDIVNAGSTGGWFQGFSASTFSANTTISNWLLPTTNWSPVSGDKINNQQGSGQCDVTNQTGSICAQSNGDAYFIAANTTTPFWYIQGGLNGATVDTAWHFMANATKGTAGGIGTGNAFALSDDLTWTPCTTSDCGGSTPPPPGVPEPATLALLGSGLLGLAGIARRRLRK